MALWIHQTHAHSSKRVVNEQLHIKASYIDSKKTCTIPYTPWHERIKIYLKVPEVAHVPSFYPKGLKLRLYFSSAGSGFRDMGQFSNLPYLGMKLGK